MYLAYDNYRQTNNAASLWSIIDRVVEQSQTLNSEQQVQSQLSQPLPIQPVAEAEPVDQSGSQGYIGDLGTQGVAGPTGEVGSIGPQGLQGPAGADGIASCPNGSCVSLQSGATIPETGNMNISGVVRADFFEGKGDQITLLNASALTSGTVADARLSANVTAQGNVFNGASQLVQLTSFGDLPVLSGANLTNLNASNLSSGTVADNRLSSNVTLQGNSFNNASQLVQLDGSGFLPALNGSALINLDASALDTGTVSDSRLSSNVALLNANQTFSGSILFQNSANSATAFRINNASGTNAVTVDTTNNTTTITNLRTSGITVGTSGSLVSQIRTYSVTIDPANVAAASTAEQTYTVTGLATNDIVTVNKPSHTSGCGIVGARVSAADTLAITWNNSLAILGCNPPSETYLILAVRS